MESSISTKQKNLEHFVRRRENPPLQGLTPLLLWVEITSRCNLKCVKCGHNFAPPVSRDLPEEMLDSLDPFFAGAVRVRTFGYGEMFLYAKLRELVERLKRFQCVVDGVTNGVLIGNGEADWLIDQAFDVLTFSIDGARPETMARLRGVNANRIFQILAYFRDRKRQLATDRPRIVVNFVAEACNIRELPELAQKLAELQVHFLGVNPLYKPGAQWEDGKYGELYRASSLSHVDRESVETALNDSRNIARDAGYHFGSYLDLDAEYAPVAKLVQIETSSESPERDSFTSVPGRDVATKTLPNHYCSYPWLALYVHADTNVRMCCYMEGSIGQARNGHELSIAWESQVAQEVRESVAHGQVHPLCAGCVERGYYKHSEADSADIQTVLKAQVSNAHGITVNTG